MTVIEYVTNLTVRRTATFYFIGSSGKGVWKFNGETFSEEEFEEKYPIPTRLFQKANYDSTKDWQY